MSGQAPDNRGPDPVPGDARHRRLHRRRGRPVRDVRVTAPAPTAPATSPAEPSEQPKKQKERRHKPDKPRPERAVPVGGPGGRDRRARSCPAAAPGSSAAAGSWWPTTARPAPARSGVLGETTRPDARAGDARGAPFRREGERVQPVYELIVTVADRHAGRDGDFSHDIDRALVQRVHRRRPPPRARSCSSTSSPAGRPSRRWRNAGPGRWSTPGSGWRSTPSGGSAPRQVPARVIGRVRAAR